jgi:hypothetical protein
MTFADFQTELLSHEMLLENQKQHLPPSNNTSFAFYSNRTNSSTSHPSNKKPKFPPNSQPRLSTPSPRYSFATPRLSAPQVRSHIPHNAPSRNTPQTMTPRAPITHNQRHLVACYICGKFNHTALDCYHRLDYAYQGRHPLPQLQA